MLSFFYVIDILLGFLETIRDFQPVAVLWRSKSAWPHRLNDMDEFAGAV